MHPPTTRLVAFGVLFAVALTACALGWEIARFGTSLDATSLRLERQVRSAISARSDRIQSLARQVAAEGPSVDAAAGDRDRLPALFDRLSALARSGTGAASAVTVYVPAGPPGEHRVLAWSGGPAEDLNPIDLASPERLAGVKALFVAPGTLGLRLVFVHPVEFEGRRVAIVATETLLSPTAAPAGSAGTFQLDTDYGPVSLTPSYGAAGEGPRPARTFVVTNPSGGPLLEVEFEPARLTEARWLFRRRALAVAMLPLVVVLLLLTGPIIDRRRLATTAGRFLAWSMVGAALVAAAGAASLGLLAMSGATHGSVFVIGLTAIGLTALGPLSWWWRRPRRPIAREQPARWLVENMAGGLLLAAALVLASRPWRTAGAIAPLLPLDGGALLTTTGWLLIRAAALWMPAALLAWLSGRWQFRWRRIGRSLATLACWLAPTLIIVGVADPRQLFPALPMLLVALTAAAFAVFATRIRRFYRRATQLTRLALLFGALLGAAAVWAPLNWITIGATAERLIAGTFAPATAGHPQQLLDALEETQRDIDRIAGLDAIVAADRREPASAIPTQLAFAVWSRTGLARSRLTSAVQLYGPDGQLLSRFALNVPEYGSIDQTYEGTRCDWEVFGEVGRFGADERRLLHAERGLCDRSGKPRGAVVVHVTTDYRALPFISSINPYDDVLGRAEATSRLPGSSPLHVVVYGWGLTPLFTSGTLAWPLSPDLFARIYRSREPFWTTLAADNRWYRVHFSNDRAGIYALGYAVPLPFERVTDLAETAAITGVLFVLLLTGATIYTPLARRRPAPLRSVVHEVRTSFYRKLFLYFVLAAIVPVLALSLAFGAYLATRFQADVEREASSVASVARRVLEESVALQSRAGAALPLSDDVMVWIGQVIDQDVNLFEGSALLATSQRDLVNSGLLPRRTPATAYRAIALDRSPSFVGEDQIGAFRYLVSAAGVPALGRDLVLSVPLALRQREMERELTELNRGLLVAGVLIVLLAAGLGTSIARRVSDPVARLTRATRQIAAGRLDVRIVADTADELRRLVDDFNSMAATLSAQRMELARTHQLAAWAEMARQVAHEIKNPLTPVQLAAEHLRRVNEDHGRPLGPVAEHCIDTILGQVKLLRRIAGEFSNYAAAPTPRLEDLPAAGLVNAVVQPYLAGLPVSTRLEVRIPSDLPAVRIDRTLVTRALTNIVENALQAMPTGGTLEIAAEADRDRVVLTFSDSGVGLTPEALSRAFEPYFSTKTAGSGLGLANAKRNIELCGGVMRIASAPGRGAVVTVELPVAADSGGAGTA